MQRVARAARVVGRAGLRRAAPRAVGVRRPVRRLWGGGVFEGLFGGRPEPVEEAEAVPMPPTPVDEVELREDGLYMLPLGGCGHIGMNATLYGAAGKWMLVDLGMMMVNQSDANVELPDTRFIEEHREAFVGLVVTHGHEDHVGAILALWERLRCPIHATPLVIAMLKLKMRVRRIQYDVDWRPVDLAAPEATLGPFGVRWVQMPHSTPESFGLRIQTPRGTVFHTGDFKFDPAPLLAPPCDEAGLRAMGDEGVLAVVADSTNAIHPGWSGSEGRLREEMFELFEQLRDTPGTIFATCFASNLARVQTLALAAQHIGRRASVVGRSIEFYTKVGVELGYFDEESCQFEEHGLVKQLYPPGERVVILTGCQAESGAALSRATVGMHPELAQPEEGDVVIFSSSIIPGNRGAVRALHTVLRAGGVRVIQHGVDGFTTHVSGHPHADELRHLYRLLRPQICVPVHGEPEHQEAHAAIAREEGVGAVVIPQPGGILSLDGGEPRQVARIALRRVSSRDGGALAHEERAGRTRIAPPYAIAIVSIDLDRHGALVGDPTVSLQSRSRVTRKTSPELDEHARDIVDAVQAEVSGWAWQHADQVAQRRAQLSDHLCAMGQRRFGAAVPTLVQIQHAGLRARRH